MSGVVLRCPNCGTSQPAEGQCEACHEAAVRYFCANHTPGVWLSSASCPQCGARFGDPAPARREPRFSEPPRVRPTVVRDPASRSADLEPGPWDADSPSELDRASGPSVRPDPFRVLLGAMAAAARARAAERSPYDDARPVRHGGGGCIGRIFMLVLLLVALVLMLPFFLSALLGF